MRKIVLFLFVCLLSTGAIRSQTKLPPVSDTTALKQALQLKLDEWHKAGSFPGATLGVVRTLTSVAHLLKIFQPSVYSS